MTSMYEACLQANNSGANIFGKCAQQKYEMNKFTASRMQFNQNENQKKNTREIKKEPKAE